jgi:hypothetical protein
MSAPFAPSTESNPQQAKISCYLSLGFGLEEVGLVSQRRPVIGDSLKRSARRPEQIRPGNLKTEWINQNEQWTPDK